MLVISMHNVVTHKAVDKSVNINQNLSQKTDILGTSMVLNKK